MGGVIGVSAPRLRGPCLYKQGTLNKQSHFTNRSFGVFNFASLALTLSENARATRISGGSLSLPCVKKNLKH